jgi:hypothetical protein
MNMLRQIFHAASLPLRFLAVGLSTIFVYQSKTLQALVTLITALAALIDAVMKERNKL